MTPEQRERGERLRDLVETLKGKPCVYGQDGDDCSMLPLQWVVDTRYREAGAVLEVDVPDYSSREEAAQVIEEAGGLVNLWEPIARKLGLTPLHDRPEIGDIGIIETSVGHVGGIWLHGQAFLWRAEQGVRVIGIRDKRIIKSWRV